MSPSINVALLPRNHHRLFPDSGLDLVLGLGSDPLDSINALLSLVLGSLDAPFQFRLLFSAPVVVRQVSVSLGELCAFVDEVASEEEVVLR